MNVRGLADSSELTLAEFSRRIVHEDADLLVLDKPAGWPIHGDRHHPSNQTILALALKYLPQQDFSPAFVHRLDKETSGLLILAKTRSALQSLNRQLKWKKIKKIYIALVAGEISPKGSIRMPLTKQLDRERWLALMVPVRRGGMHAQTDYQRLELLEYADEKLSLVEARPRTGRTHQLRAHFAALGFPIVGDDLYGRVQLNEKLRRELGVGRQLLHAHTLEFAHPTTGSLVRFETPLAVDLVAVLEKLRRHRTL